MNTDALSKCQGENWRGICTGLQGLIESHDHVRLALKTLGGILSGAAGEGRCFSRADAEGVAIMLRVLSDDMDLVADDLREEVEVARLVASGQVDAREVGL